MVNTTVNAKNAFNPIPGANAIGYLAISPMNSEPTNAANAVATKWHLGPFSYLSDTPLTPANLKLAG